MKQRRDLESASVDEADAVSEVLYLAVASLGQTTVTADNGSGNFQIDSFFDIFTEISVNGGAFVPANNSTFVNLVPEPSAFALLALGLLGCGWRKNR